MSRRESRKGIFTSLLLAVLVLAAATAANAQNALKGKDESAAASKTTTGYATHKPIVGGACPGCPWGAMAEVVRAAMKPYGWDIQICYYCAGSAREARLVSKAAMATPPDKPSPDDMPTPKGPIDFGITGTEYLRWAYDGTNDFAKDPGTASKQLRAVAKIQEPTYFIIAVRADTGIKNLSEIVEKKMPVHMVARMGIGGITTPVVMDYFGISEEAVKSFGGTWATGFDRKSDANVFVGFGSLTNAPEYRVWYDASQKYDLKYLELPADLKAKLMKQFGYTEGVLPYNAFRGVDRPVPTLVRDGTVIYGRTDMPDEFAYDLAKAMDEHQELLQYGNSSMNWSYNYHNVWQALGVPLHPGAIRYYKEKGYMK
jgi:uncharacterized protein